MGLREFIASSRQLIKTAHKPDSSELKLMIKVCGLGVLIIGIFSFIIKFIAALLYMAFASAAIFFI